MMNVIQTEADWVNKVIGTPLPFSEKSSLLNNYALKDFRMMDPDASGDYVDLWIDDLNLDSYGTHSAIFIRTPIETHKWSAVVVSDTELSANLYNAGIAFRDDGEGVYASRMDKHAMATAYLWFLVNREVLKKYKTVIKMGKRRHLIQDMGEKRANAYHQKPIKISDGISYTWEYENPRSFNRHCEAWGVRGHYRHYKNGKVVFIHPYIKGSGRLKDSLYEL